jgi:hypothetical protein
MCQTFPAVINFRNPLMITARGEPGHHEPGLLEAA